MGGERLSDYRDHAGLHEIDMRNRFVGGFHDLVKSELYFFE
jgi:hypothetical protein